MPPKKQPPKKSGAQRKKQQPKKPKAGHKGAKSKTHPGDMDYTTKRGDKDFHRRGHDVSLRINPYETL